MYKQFLKDPNYLTKYHAAFAGVLFLLNLSLAYYRAPEFLELALFLPAVWFGSMTDIRVVIGTLFYAIGASFFLTSFNPTYFYAIPVAVLITFPLTAMIHNPSHDSVRPRWLNRPVGELVGLFHMIGFPDWKIIHIFHHQHSDHPEFDPHPPGQKTYLQFVLSMRKMAAAAFILHYCRIFGQSEDSARRLKWFSLASRADMLMRATFWYFVLGAQLFTYLFLTSISFKMLHYAWFNYATHRFIDGEYRTQNFNHWGYKFINAIAWGLYYHDNHHSQPSLFNPKHMPQRTKSAAEKSAA